jgi:hypothetical protein
MKIKVGFQRGHFLLAACILSFLTFWFARYIQTSSFDLVQHFLLVDELSRHGEVQHGAFERIGAMALYPPAAHWMAVIVGWIGGSSLVGISIVSIASVYFCYILIICLVGAGSLSRILALVIAFLASMFTHSLIGWEVSENYFYPQLVADVVYFGALYWALTNREIWKQTSAFLLFGFIAMWIQPLVALHVLAAGCALMAFLMLHNWSKGNVARWIHAVNLVTIVVGAAVIVFTNPAFKVMREIAANDGYLVFGYPSAMLVTMICGAIGSWNLVRYWTGKGEYADLILSSAVLAAVGLVILQFALLKLNGDGSDYAIKKHMFIVFTLGVMNVVRLIPISWITKKNLSPGFVAPILAGLASVFALQGYNTPVAPIVNALTYANHVAEYKLTEFSPGSTVSDDAKLPLMGNVMVSMTAFQHPFNARSIAWVRGTSIRDGAQYVMIRSTPYIEKICQQKLADSGGYVVVDPTCLHTYLPGEQLSFAAGGNAWQYTSGGWGGPEVWGAWSLGDVESSVLLDLPTGSYELAVEGMAYLNAQHPSQTIVVEANGTEIAKWIFDQAQPSGVRLANIPESLTKSGSLRIVIKAPGAVSPRQLGQSEDSRVVGLGMKTLSIRAAR